MEINRLQTLIVNALEDTKGHDIEIIDTTKLSPLFERIIIVSGSSSRQVKALARNVADKVREAGGHVLSSEGEESAEWILVDFGSIVVHVMQPAIRAHYDLETLWSTRPISRRTA